MSRGLLIVHRRSSAAGTFTSKHPRHVAVHRPAQRSGRDPLAVEPTVVEAGCRRTHQAHNQSAEVCLPVFSSSPSWPRERAIFPTPYSYMSAEKLTGTPNGGSYEASELARAPPAVPRADTINNSQRYVVIPLSHQGFTSSEKICISIFGAVHRCILGNISFGCCTLQQTVLLIVGCAGF